MEGPIWPLNEHKNLHFNLMMNKICIWTLRILRQLVMGTILICSCSHTNCAFYILQEVGVHFKDMLTWKPSGHGSCKSLNSHWWRLSRPFTLGLQEGSFRPQPITFLVEEKIYIESHVISMDNVGRICGEFLLVWLMR